MNGGVVLDGRLGPDGLPITTDSIKWTSTKEGDNMETTKEGLDVDKGVKVGLAKDEAIKEGFGEKEIIDKGLEDNHTIKKDTIDGPNAEKDRGDIDGSGMPAAGASVAQVSSKQEEDDEEFEVTPLTKRRDEDE